MRVGVVLGAGGLPGDAFHRGTLAALKDVWGIDAREASVLVGTSAGAMTLTSLRSPPGPDPSPEKALPMTGPEQRRLVYLPDRRHLWANLPDVLPDLRGLTGYVLRPWRARPGAVVAALLPPGRQSTELLTGSLRRRFAGRWPAETTWVVAVRRRDGRRVVFGRDDVETDLPTAVAASCAIPAYFRPVVIGGDQYVDGAMHSPTNADVLAEEGPDLVVISAPMGIRLAAASFVVDLPLRLTAHALLQREVLALRRHGVATVTLEPGGELLRMLGVNPVSALRIDEIEERAYADAAQRLRARPSPLGSLPLSRGAEPRIQPSAKAG